MRYIVVNHCSGNLLGLTPGRGALRCRAFWTRSAKQVKKFDSLKFAYNVARCVGGMVLTTREAQLDGLLTKGGR